MKNKITDLRNHLFETIEMLKDGDEDVNKMTVEKAKAIAQVSGKIIDSAKLEVQWLKALQDLDQNHINTGFLPTKNSND